MATPRSRFLTSLALVATLFLAACCGPQQTRTEGEVEVGVATDPNPAELGDNAFRVFVKVEGEKASDAQVALRMFMPGMPMNSDNNWIPATLEKKGVYGAVGDFSMGGNWQVEVRTEPPGREPVLVSFPFEIKWELK